MNKKQELIKNTIIIFLGKVCTQFISFLLLPLYTSYLITEDYGIVDLLITYTSLLVPILSLQLESAIFRFLIDDRKQKEKINKIISSALISVSIILTCFTLVCSLFFIIVDVKYKWIILLTIIANTYASCLLQIARGIGDNIKFSISSVISGTTSIILNIVLIVIFKMGAVGMLSATLISNISCFVYLFFSLKLYKRIKLKYYNKKLVKKMINYSLPLIPNGISWWVFNVSDRTLISLFINVSANGIYAVSNKFPAIFSGFLGIFSMSWNESASLHIDSEDKNEFFSDTFNTSIKLFSCIGLGIIGCLPFIFPILIDINYSEAYYYIPILIVAALFNLIVCLYSAIYIAKKKTREVANTSIFAAIINLVINLIFIEKIGVYAACLSTVLSYLVLSIYRFHDSKKYVIIKYDIKSLLLIILTSFIVITLYYINDLLFNIINLIIIILLSIVLNYGIIIKILKK